MEYPDLSSKQLEALHKKGVLNGCGGKGGFIKPPSFMFEASCNWHDYNYWRGGTEADRKHYDKGFYKAMLRDASRASCYNVYIYKLSAWVYYTAVRLFGKKYFTYGIKKDETAIRIYLHGQGGN